MDLERTFVCDVAHARDSNTPIGIHARHPRDEWFEPLAAHRGGVVEHHVERGVEHDVERGVEVVRRKRTGALTLPGIVPCSCPWPMGALSNG